MGTYLAAETVDQALAAMAAGARPVAGGTDLVVGARQGKKPLPGTVVGIHRIAGLSEITRTAAGELSLGTLVSHATILTDPRILAGYTGLADASAIVGSHATRANGTIGGNVMNASPAMDTGAPLVVLGAEVELQSAEGTRRVALEDLWTAPGRTSARTSNSISTKPREP